MKNANILIYPFCPISLKNPDGYSDLYSLLSKES